MNKQNLELYRTPTDFRGRSKIVVQLWWLVQSLLFRTSPQFMYGWRRFLLKSFGAKIGKNVLIRPTARFTYPWKIEIGDYSWIGDDVVLYSLGKIRIGSHSVVSQKSYLCTGTHDYSKIDFPILAKPIEIGNECWLATDVYIAPGISIGDGAVVAARSTVLDDVKANMIYLGTPAKPFKER